MRYTKCLECGAPAEVIDGLIARHVRPTDLRFCGNYGGSANAEPMPPQSVPEAPAAAPKKRPAKKTTAKKPAE